MTKWVIQFTVVVDNGEQTEDKEVSSARDALIHAKDIIAARISTRNRVLVDIDETFTQRNRYTGNFNTWRMLEKQ